MKDSIRRFARRISYGSLFVTQTAQHRAGPHRESWRAPARVGDLHVAFLQGGSGRPRAISLGWTATGNVLDSGRASSYILKRFPTWEEAALHFDSSGVELADWEFDDGRLSPKAAGQVERIFFKLAVDVVLPQFFALKVNSTLGALSPVSNVVVVSAMPPTAATSSIWASGSSQGHSGSGPFGGVTVGDFPFLSGQGSLDQRNGVRLQPSQLALIITVPLILLVIGVCILMVVVARRRKDPLFDKVHKASDKNNGINVDPSLTGDRTANNTAGNRSPVLTPSSVDKEDLRSMTKMSPDRVESPTPDRSMSTDEPNGVPVIMNQRHHQHESLSPVNHWPAEVLLAHYNKVQEAKERNEQPPLLTLRGPGHLDDPGQLAKPLYGSVDPFRSLSPPVRSSPTGNQTVQQSALNNVIYPPYYDSSPPIVTSTGAHVNSSRNITHV